MTHRTCGVRSSSLNKSRQELNSRNKLLRNDLERGRSDLQQALERNSELSKQLEKAQQALKSAEEGPKHLKLPAEGSAITLGASPPQSPGVSAFRPKISMVVTPPPPDLPNSSHSWSLRLPSSSKDNQQTELQHLAQSLRLRNEELQQMQTTLQRLNAQLAESQQREKEQAKTYRQKLVSLELECIQLKGALLDRHGKQPHETEHSQLD